MKLYEWKNAELATLIREKFNIPTPKVEEEADKNTGVSGYEGDDEGKTSYGHMKQVYAEDSGEEEGEHYERNVEHDDDHISAIRHHLDALEHDKDYDEEHVDEGGLAGRKSDPRQRRPEDNRLREEEEESEEGTKKKAKAPYAPTKASFGSKARARQRERGDKSTTARVFGGVTEEDQPLDEAKVRKAVREALKQFLSKR